MPIFGGTVRMTLNGNDMQFRGELNIEPSAYEATVGTNDSGSIYQSLKPMAAKAEMKLEDSGGLDWNRILIGGPYPIQFVEETTGVLHLFPAAHLSGRPKIDRMTGEVTGLAVNSPAYTKREG